MNKAEEKRIRASILAAKAKYRPHKIERRTEVPEQNLREMIKRWIADGGEIKKLRAEITPKVYRVNEKGGV